MLTREQRISEPPKLFVTWWHGHRDHKHGIPARVAYKCECYLEEYTAASLLAPLLKTTEPGAGARRKAGQRSGVQ
jgi:hypothetical protein